MHAAAVALDRQAITIAHLVAAIGSVAIAERALDMSLATGGDPQHLQLSPLRGRR